MATYSIKKITLPNGDVCNLRDDTKQETLVSGTNIKSINGSSVLGSGDLTVSVEIDASVIALATSMGWTAS